MHVGLRGDLPEGAPPLNTLRRELRAAVDELDEKRRVASRELYEMIRITDNSVTTIEARLDGLTT